MSVKAETESNGSSGKSVKRKRDAEEPELEIDLGAPEPPSKKALRKSKKQKPSSTSKSTPLAKEEDNDNVATPKKSSSAPHTQSSNEKDVEPQRSQYGIWIGNLSFATTKDDLTTFLGKNSIESSQVTRVHLPQGPPKFGKPQNKGFAYIDFSDSPTHVLAMALSESLLGGRRILIKDAKSFEGRPQKEPDNKDASGKPPNQRIFVGNLGFDTAVEDLETHFGVCGCISNVHMATFEDSGKCKGFAWIEFEELGAAVAAMRGWALGSEGGKHAYLHQINGRKLRLEYAEDKTTRYNKRYGKGSKKALNEGEQDETQENPIEEVREDKQAGLMQRKKGRQSKRDRPRDHGGRKSGYDADVVKRLKGSIVEGAGEKTVFE